MARHAQTRSAYIVQTTRALASKYKGRGATMSGWARKSAQLRISDRTANPTTTRPRIHWTARHAALPTQCLAVPPLADLRHVVGGEPPAPRFPLAAALSEPLGIVRSEEHTSELQS